MTLKGKRVAILAEDLYQELELWYPLYRLREEGAEVTVVGAGKERYTSKHGYPVEVQASIDIVKADDFDGVIIPGGYAPDLMRRNQKMVDFVKRAHDQGKIIAAICHAGWMLASAGIIKGKRVTGFFSIKDDLVHAGARYEDKEVIRDHNIITSRRPDDLPAFCRTVIEALAEVREKVGVSK